MSTTRATALSVSVILLSGAAHAQWSSNPASNQSLADATSDQSQPKLVATADGGVYLSWFDGIGSGYDVRLQRLDSDGVETFAHNGVLVADRGFSSTQDYGLSIAANGHALLAFRDDRLGGVQITAARVDAAGGAAWGALGIQLTNTTSFLAAPKIAGTADGGAVVAWTQDQTVRLNRLDATGAAQWAADVVFSPPAGSYSVADLRASGDDVIVSIVHQTGGFTSPRRLVTQKLDATGAPLWGAAPINVFDTGSIQIGNFPSFTTDSAGGAVFSWYTTSPLQCWVQRILSNGAEAFPHNGVAVSTNAAQIRVNPSASFVPATGETVVSWREQNSTQSQFGLGSQKLDATGNRLWGPAGITHIPLGSSEIDLVLNASDDAGSFVVWASAPSFGQDTLHALRLDPAGGTLDGPFDVSSTPSNKMRLAGAKSSIGQLILAWSDDRVDSGDVYGQNINCDATLGPPSTSAAWTDVGNALAGATGAPVFTGSGTLCAGDAFALSLSNARANTSAALILGFNQANAPLLGGTLVPSPDVVVAGLPTGPSGSIDIAGVLPSPLTAGLTLYLQYWIVDDTGPFGAAASNGLQMTAP